ncbi:MAG TPA: fibronectin type III domain-containing protein [Trebonia sp.]
MNRIRRRAAATAVAVTAAAAASVGITAASAAPMSAYAGVTDVAVPAVTGDSASVTWTAPAADRDAKFQVVVYGANDPAAAAAYDKGGISGSKVTATGLMPGTAYDVKVSAQAGDGHTPSSFTVAGPFFTTAMAGPTGPQGRAGAPGMPGKEGPQGPSGVVATGATTLQAITAPAMTVATGGSFSKQEQPVGRPVSLKAGTYLVTVNFVATPDASTNGAVFPQLFVYAGGPASGFTNDLYNVGAGALEDPTATILSDGDVINSYYSGTFQVVIPADGASSLNVYAFGYDSDTGTGSYALNEATLTATQLQPAS